MNAAARNAMLDQMMQNDLARALAQQNGLYNSQMGSISGAGIMGPPTYYPGPAGVAQEYAPDPKESYEKELYTIRKRTSTLVDVTLGVVLGMVLVVGSMVFLIGPARAALMVLSVAGGVGLYLGLHKAAFLYYKRKFDIAQATKAMLE